MSCKNCLVLIYFPSGSSCQIIIQQSRQIYVYTPSPSLLNNIPTWLGVLSFIISFNPLQESLGFSSKTTFFCRGQSLPLKLLDFLSGFDILVHSAYGQTESCSVLTANVPGRYVLFYCSTSRLAMGL